MMKAILSFFFLSITLSAYSQGKMKLKVIETGIETFKMTDSGQPESEKYWTVSPQTKIDTYISDGLLLSPIHI